jgi:acetyl esterase/lipase
VTTEGGRFPVPVEDLRCALKTLKKNRNLFNLNTDRIVAIGFSAGAHLAAEIGLTSKNQNFSDHECPIQNFEPDVQGVVAYYGPYDLTNLEGLDALQTSLVVNFLGIHPFFAPSLAMWASPKAQVKKQKLPFYLVHAQNDDLVPVRSSREFSETLAQKNVPYKYVETGDGAHTLKLFDDRPFAQEATCGALEYLNNFLTQ